MGRVRIVWGTGRGSTALSAYDAALAAANVHDYNLIQVSSVLPAEASVDPVRAAPDLGPVGGRLTVVEARETAAIEAEGTSALVDTETNASADADTPAETDRSADDRLADPGTEVVRAGLGWAQASNGRGIVYEATGTESDEVHRAIETGLRAGCALRDLSPVHTDRIVLSTDGATERVETADGAPDVPAGDHERTPMDAGRSVALEHVREGSETPRDTGGDPGDERYVTAVVLAVYGDSDPIL